MGDVEGGRGAAMWLPGASVCFSLFTSSVVQLSSDTQFHQYFAFAHAFHTGHVRTDAFKMNGNAHAAFLNSRSTLPTISPCSFKVWTVEVLCKLIGTVKVLRGGGGGGGGDFTNSVVFH